MSYISFARAVGFTSARFLLVSTYYSDAAAPPAPPTSPRHRPAPTPSPVHGRRARLHPSLACAAAICLRSAHTSAVPPACRPRRCIVPPAPLPRHLQRHSPLHVAAPLRRSTPPAPFTHRAARSTHPAPPLCRVSPLTLRKPCRALLVLTPPRWVVRRERGRKLSLSSRSTSGPEQRGRPRGPRWWPRPPRSRLRGMLVRSESGSNPAGAEAEAE